MQIHNLLSQFRCESFCSMSREFKERGEQTSATSAVVGLSPATVQLTVRSLMKGGAKLKSVALKYLIGSLLWR